MGLPASQGGRGPLDRQRRRRTALPLIAKIAVTVNPARFERSALWGFLVGVVDGVVSKADAWPQLQRKVAKGRRRPSMRWQSAT
jgi:hypothetical protein